MFFHSILHYGLCLVLLLLCTMHFLRVLCCSRYVFLLLVVVCFHVFLPLFFFEQSLFFVLRFLIFYFFLRGVLFCVCFVGCGLLFIFSFVLFVSYLILCALLIFCFVSGECAPFVLPFSLFLSFSLVSVDGDIPL